MWAWLGTIYLVLSLALFSLAILFGILGAQESPQQSGVWVVIALKAAWLLVFVCSVFTLYNLHSGGFASLFQKAAALPVILPLPILAFIIVSDR